MKSLSGQYSLPPIADFLSLPGKDLMDHALKNRLTESPGLLLHSLLGGIVAYALAKHLPPDSVDVDTLLSLGLISHSTRIIADEGLKGSHQDPAVNEYMKDHSNINFAHEDAKREGFSDRIIRGLAHFDSNPISREGYFPHEVMVHPSGDINWTEALYQIASWSIAGGITTLDARFHDLRTRRSEEFGRLESKHIKDMSQKDEIYDIPKPILDEARKEFPNIDSESFRKMVIECSLSDRQIGEYILSSYETWATGVRQKYCELVGADDFDAFLRQQVDTVTDSDMRNKIKLSFESAIGRTLRDDEYFPTIPGIELIYNRIGAMKVSETQNVAMARIRKLMGNIERVTRPFLRPKTDS